MPLRPGASAAAGDDATCPAPIILSSADTTTLERYQQLFSGYRCQPLCKPFELPALPAMIAELLASLRP